ncbi:MAG: tyrosine-type recombinase/integrase [Lachnospiraceae bacterium]|jgi:integrase/recombinase XerD
MSKIPFDQLFFSRTNDYLNVYLPRQAHRSGGTVKTYRTGLSDFYGYVTGVEKLQVMNFRFQDCTYDFVLKYSQYLQEERQLEPSSVNQKLSVIRNYVRYVADGSIDLMQVYLSVQKVPMLRVPKVQRPVLEKDSIQKLLAAPADTKKGNRDRTILILLFDTAIRVAELCAITMGDVQLNVDMPCIVINGKGKKQRAVVLTHRSAEYLKYFVMKYHHADEDPSTPLFPTIIHGQVHHMTERNVERILTKYADQLKNNGVSLPESVYPHMMRRSRATGMYRDGVPLEMVSAILGHANTETTKIYAIPSVDQLRDALSKGEDLEGEEDKAWEGQEDEMKKLFGL